MRDGAAPIVVVAPGDDLLRAAAEHTLTCLYDAERSLTDVTVVVPYAGVVRGLRETLSRVAATHGVNALLGPQIIPYRNWLAQRSRQPPRPRVLRELQLYDLLRNFPQHFDHGDLWQVCDSMLPLLEELDTQQVEPKAFSNLARYDPRLAGQLGQEAQVISAVWQALHDDVPDQSPLTLASQVTSAFASLIQHDAACVTLFIGCDELSALECKHLIGAVRRERAIVCLQYHDRHPNPALAESLSQLPIACADSQMADHSGYAFLHRCLDNETPQAPAAAGGGGFRHRWVIVPCIDDETQVQFVADDMATTHDEMPLTAVVSENRRLLRRLRAVLESRGVAVDDEAGWTLSTTAAATVVQRLLDSIDQDFHYLPFLDLLKSPYLLPAELFENHAQLEATVHRFELSVIRRGQVHSELRRLRWHLESQTARAVESRENELVRALELLQVIEDATRDLQRFHMQGRPRPVQAFLKWVLQALERLGCTQRLLADPAGEQLLDLLGQLGQDTGARIHLAWSDARTWLARSLEQQRFQPERRGASVRLLNLREAVVDHFDVVYLLGANQEHLPGQDGNVSAFFNDGVRRELGLRTRADTLALTRHRLKLLLSNTASVIACYARESQGEPLQATQWLTAVDSWHATVFGVGLHTVEIDTHVPSRPAAAPGLPPTWAEISARPAPAVDRRLVPAMLSASAHQRLIDCPYLFYAQDCLGLRNTDEIAEKLRKSEYGNRVHTCLQLFHDEPDTLDLLLHEPERATRRLFDISTRVFQRDIENNFEHRVWLHRWQRSIPAYIAWQAERALRYPHTSTEVALSRELAAGLSLEGKIDRIDRDDHGAAAIIDYKTGQAGSTGAVRAGEDVQIVSYALLVDDVERIEYLQFDGERIRRKGALEQPEATTVSEAVAARLVDTKRRLHDGSPLPAWQGPRCTYCDMQGVCRQPLWKLST